MHNQFTQDEKDSIEKDSPIVIKTNVNGAIFLIIALSELANTTKHQELIDAAKTCAESLFFLASQVEKEPIKEALIKGQMTMTMGIEDTETQE